MESSNKSTGTSILSIIKLAFLDALIQTEKFNEIAANKRLERVAESFNYHVVKYHPD